MDSQLLSIIGAEWKGKTGQTRYYLNDWLKICKIDARFIGSRNDKGVLLFAFDCYLGRRMTDEWGGRIDKLFKEELCGTKIWLDDEANIHVDYCKNEFYAKEFAERVKIWFDQILALDKYIRSSERTFSISWMDYTGYNWYADTINRTYKEYIGSVEGVWAECKKLRDAGMDMVSVGRSYPYECRDVYLSFADKLERLYETELKAVEE